MRAYTKQRLFQNDTKFPLNIYWYDDGRRVVDRKADAFMLKMRAHCFARHRRIRRGHRCASFVLIIVCLRTTQNHSGHRLFEIYSFIYHICI